MSTTKSNGPPPRTPRGEDRRLHPRADAGGRVLVLSPVKAEATLADISRTGMRVMFERATKLTRGQEVNVSFTLPGSDLKISSRLEVVRRQGPQEVGFRFLRLSPEILTEIDAYVGRQSE